MPEPAPAQGHQLARLEGQLGKQSLTSTAQQTIGELRARAVSAEEALAVLHTEAAELRVANVALKQMASEEHAANDALAKSSSALEECVSELEAANHRLKHQLAAKEGVERKQWEAEVALEERKSAGNNPHADVGRPEWLEREYLSDADRDLTFDVTCKVLDDMRTELVGSRAVQAELEVQVTELMAELDVLKAKALAADKISEYNAQGAELGLPPVSAAMNLSSAAQRAPQRTVVAVQGTMDLRDEVMAVAEQLLERSQSMCGAELTPSPACRSSSEESEASVSGALQGLRAALETGEHASARVSTSRVSPRTRTELMHSVMAQRELLDAKRRAAEADQRRQEDGRRSHEQIEQGEAERRKREEEARLRREKVRRAMPLVSQLRTQPCASNILHPIPSSCGSFLLV
jgi:hypothetical protein